MFVLPVKHRIRAREIACSCWEESSGDENQVIELTKSEIAKDKSKGTYGNPLMALIVAYYIANLCYLAYKIWRDQRVKHPPTKPIAGEPFGLYEGAK